MSTSASSSSPARRFVVLLPVKPPGRGKTRLSSLGDQARRDLAHAFAVDTLEAVLACPRVDRALVVTDDHRLAEAMRTTGADVLPDGASGLNETLVQAAAEAQRRHPTLTPAALCADLPALRPEELARALDDAAPDSMSFVADVEGVGTTMVTAPTATSFRPAFGAGSRLAHLSSGASEITGTDILSVRRDVDEPAALEEAVRLGVGRRTSLVLAALRRP